MMRLRIQTGRSCCGEAALLDHLCLELAAKSGVADLDQALDVLVYPATCPVIKLDSAIKWHQAISLAHLESYRMLSYALVVAS